MAEDASQLVEGGMLAGRPATSTPSRTQAEAWVVSSAKPVVEKPARVKPLANGQTDKARASPNAYRELSPPPPKPLAIAKPPKPALTRATSGPAARPGRSQRKRRSFRLKIRCFSVLRAGWRSPSI